MKAPVHIYNSIAPNS